MQRIYTLTALVVIYGAASVHASVNAYVTSVEDENALYSVDLATAAAHRIGDFGVGGYMASLAWDPTAGIMYGTNTGTNNLYTINLNTGQADLVGALGTTLVHGLAFNPRDGFLYGVQGSGAPNAHLLRISPSTGAASVIGALASPEDNLNGLSGLDFHADGRLIGSWSGGGLYEIDTATGRAQLLTASGPFNGISFHPLTGQLYGVYNQLGPDVPSSLYRIDLASGGADFIGDLPIQNSLAIQIIPEPTSALLPGLFLFMIARRGRGRSSTRR